jgi:hypothetical protein
MGGRLQMLIALNVGIPYSDWIGIKEIPLELDCAEATLRDVMVIFLHQFPEFKVKLQESKMLDMGLPKALFLVNGKAAQSSHIIQDGSKIRMLFPIVGG